MKSLYHRNEIRCENAEIVNNEMASALDIPLAFNYSPLELTWQKIIS